MGDEQQPPFRGLSHRVAGQPSNNEIAVGCLDGRDRTGDLEDRSRTWSRPRNKNTAASFPKWIGAPANGIEALLRCPDAPGRILPGTWARDKSLRLPVSLSRRFGKSSQRAASKCLPGNTRQSFSIPSLPPPENVSFVGIFPADADNFE